MLRVPRHDIKQGHDHYKKYKDEHHHLITFQEGDKVFLKVPEHLAGLKTGPVAKLSPRYCDPFIKLKCISQAVYKLALLKHSRIHSIFHVSYLHNN